MFEKRTIENHKGQTAEFLLREGTTDVNCFREIYERSGYRHKKFGFDVEDGERWLDLGANVGVFAAYAFSKGAVCACYEPDESNFYLAQHNLQNIRQADGGAWEITEKAVTHLKQEKLQFYRGKKDSDKYRYSTKGSENYLYKELPNLWAGELRGKYDGIKMDIEGSELDLIDGGFLIGQTNKLVFEYHLTKDRSMANFHRRMKILRDIFSEVYYMPSLDRFPRDGEYPGFFDRLIYAKK